MQDLLGKPCYSMFHGLDAPPASCPHTQLMQDGLSHSVEIFEPRLNSHLDVTVTPLYGPDGKVTGSIHVAHDITGLKQAGEALRESELLYRSILTASPDNITITDLKGRIRMVSPKGLAMYGCECEEQLLGRTVVEFVSPEDRERATTNIMRMFQGTYTGPDEYRALRADGSTIIIEANGDFICSTSGRPESMVFVIRDITERKRVEGELNSKNADIEQFIYTVSHDLRSPLVTVKTFLGYLQQDITTGDCGRIGKDMDFIHTAADRMEALLNELLDMSRVGRAATPNEEVTFQELAAEALDAVAGQISTGKVDVRVSTANPALSGDRRRLLQIWQNLLDNAVKYMGDQALPRIEIGVEQQQGETVFTVSDNGIGIAPAYHEKVFGIFEKLDRTTGGVGMGLTMVRRIVEMYGGQIRIVSEGLGHGSCFRFTLPGALSQE
jgi:PAS domain S-box-containing protein